MRRLVRSAFARLTVPNSCWSCHTVRPLASAVSHAVRRSRCISWTTPDASRWIVLLLKSPTISKPRHAQVSHLLSGPTFWLVWAVLGWHHAWQVAGGRRAGRSRQVCLASSYPVLHASILRGTLGADLCPFRRLESLGHVRGHRGMANSSIVQSCRLLGAAVSRRWEETERLRRNLRTSIRDTHQPPVPCHVGRHLDRQAYCGTTAQHTAQGTCVQLSANRAAKPAPSFVSALLPNLK